MSDFKYIYFKFEKNIDPRWKSGDTNRWVHKLSFTSKRELSHMGLIKIIKKTCTNKKLLLGIWRVDVIGSDGYKRTVINEYEIYEGKS